MTTTKFPLPKKYWIYIILCIALGISLFVNIFVTAEITDNKEFWDFTQQDWHYFALFLLAEIIIVFLMFIFSTKAGKLNIKRESDVRQYYEHFKFSGIKLGDYDYVWFDFSEDERAKIVKQGDAYNLYVECFDYKTESWNPINAVTVCGSLEEIKKVLFFEFDFFCEENTVLDKHGDEVFREDAR